MKRKGSTFKNLKGTMPIQLGSYTIYKLLMIFHDITNLTLKYILKNYQFFAYRRRVYR